MMIRLLPPFGNIFPVPNAAAIQMFSAQPRRARRRWSGRPEVARATDPIRQRPLAVAPLPRLNGPQGRDRGAQRPSVGEQASVALGSGRDFKRPKQNVSYCHPEVPKLSVRFRPPIASFRIRRSDDRSWPISDCRLSERSRLKLPSDDGKPSTLTNVGFRPCPPGSGLNAARAIPRCRPARSALEVQRRGALWPTWGALPSGCYSTRRAASCLADIGSKEWKSCMGLQGVIRGKPVRNMSATRRRRARSITSTASSTRQRRTGSGGRTSPMSRPGRGSSTSPSSSTPTPDGSSAGVPAGPRMPASCWMRWSRRSTIAGRFIEAAWFIIATADRNTCLSSTPNASPMPGSSPRSAASATATTTLWPRRLMAITRPRSSIVADLWRSFEAVEYATLEWVDWFNNHRLLEPIGNIPPAEAEERCYAMLDEARMAA